MAIADAGLASLHDRMRWCDPDGRQVRPRRRSTGSPEPADLLATGVGGAGEAERGLTCPTAATGCGATTCAASSTPGWPPGSSSRPARGGRGGARPPDWLRLEGRTVAVLGAGAEMGPLPSLLRWGATVAAVDLPRPDLWAAAARRHERAGPAGCWCRRRRARADLGPAAGVDLLHDLPAATGWSAACPARW